MDGLLFFPERNSRKCGSFDKPQRILFPFDWVLASPLVGEHGKSLAFRSCSMVGWFLRTRDDAIERRPSLRQKLWWLILGVLPRMALASLASFRVRGSSQRVANPPPLFLVFGLTVSLAASSLLPFIPVSGQSSF